MSMASDPEAVFLGAELRRARLSAGITSQEELAARLGYERTVIAKAESGERPPSSEVAAPYNKAFPHLDGLIERWAEHVRRTEGSFPKFFLNWVDAERTATALFYWAPVLVPGVFQVEAYARPLMVATPDDAEAPEVRLAGRMERQQILSRPKPPLVTVVMAEAVLHRGIGGPEVMAEQLARLAEAGQRSNVLIQVIPAEVAAHAGLEGAASVAEQDEGPAIVYLESLTAGQTTRDPEIVAKVRQVTGMLRGEALPRGASRELMLRVAKDRWTL
jgi:transcriptional regulator with XRE-family HTH domain